MVNIESVKQAVLEVGALTVSLRARGLAHIQDKSSTIDLVTEADIAAEKLLRQALSQIDAQAEFWGEESNQKPQGSRFWVVDPIDGTTNFANGLSPHAVNVAFCQAGEPVLAVTLELPANRLYWAQQGAGAYRQLYAGHDPLGEPERLQVNRTTTLNQSLLITGFPYHRAEHPDNNLAEFAYFFARAQGVRCMGSAAMDMAHVAAGVFGAYWEAWLKPWDAAAGALLVREAGGVVVDYRGADWQLDSTGLIAHNGQADLHHALVEGIRTARAGLAEKLFEVE